MPGKLASKFPKKMHEPDSPGKIGKFSSIGRGPSSLMAVSSTSMILLRLSGEFGLSHKGCFAFGSYIRANVYGPQGPICQALSAFH
jgi:hypothetical protein